MTLAAQVLLYPVVDADFETGSYHEFAEGYFLRRDAMQWFWDQYTTDEAQRAAEAEADRVEQAGLQRLGPLAAVEAGDEFAELADASVAAAKRVGRGLRKRWAQFLDALRHRIRHFDR